MSKTMTVSELVNGYKEADQTFLWLRSLVGVTIVADPEPRPNFERMSFEDVCRWIHNNASALGDAWSINSLHLYSGIRELAEHIADKKGLAR